MSPRVALTFERFDRAELRFCRSLNRVAGLPAVRALFRCVSWLGDGWFWYALIALMPAMYGRQGVLVAVLLTATGFVGVVSYRTIKTRAVRERPFITHSAILCAAAPLDRYSFPSGHTLHAVSFSLIAASYFPSLAPLLTVFAVLVALSRVVLGLHYPTDVAAGALLGAGLALLSLSLAPLLGL